MLSIIVYYRMNKLILISFVVCFSLNLNAQKFRKSDFIKTDWFTDNKDSLFFKSDTIRLIQHTNYGPEWDKARYAEYEMMYLNHGNYLNFSFKKNRLFEYWETYNNNINIFFQAWFTWELNKREQVITVLMDGKVYFKLRPVSKRQIKIKSRYAVQKELLETTELTVIRIK